MPEKVVAVRLEAKVKGFTDGLKQAQKSLDGLTKADVPKQAQAFSDLSDKAALAGAAIGVGLGVAVKRFADFDAAMSGVRANTGATGAELESLRAAALKLGADSQFSATEAAQGINELGKAGVSTASILNGGLKGSLDLAAAGQIEVAQAAETTASALTQFGLNGDQASHVADLLTNGANKAQGGVLDLGQALQQAGLVAAGTGLSIEETTGALTAFASAGLIGSDAGTSLKTALQRLSAPSKESAELMAELGINAYDANGQFVGLASVAGQLQSAFEDKTDAERNSALATIFGADAIRAANILYNEGAEGIQKWTGEVTEQGAAARQAAELTDNLRGDVERLGGALDSVFISTGSGANGGLRTLTQGVTSLVEQIGKVPGPLLLVGGAITSGALLLPKAILGYREYRAQIEGISQAAPRAGRALSALGRSAEIGAVVTAAAIAFDALGKELAELRDIRPVGVEAAKSAILDSSDAAGQLAEALDATSGAGSRFESAANYLVLPTRLFGGEVEATKDSIVAYDTALADLVRSGNGDQAAQFLKAAGVGAKEAAERLPAYTDSLAGADNAQRLAAGSGTVLADATSSLEQAAQDAAAATEELRDSINGLGSPVAAQRQATSDFQAAIAAATASVKENGKAVGFATAAGRQNEAALLGLRQATLDKVNADYSLTGSTAAATKTMQAGRTAFINAATAAGYTKAQAEALATQLGLIPEQVPIIVKQTGAEGAGAAIDRAARERVAQIKIRVTEEGRATGTGGRNTAGGITRAGGGPIWGPGTKTSDSVPVWASHGEFMQKAAAVDKYGLHFMESVNSLRFPSELAQGYRDGGRIQPAYAPRTAVTTATRTVAAAGSSGGEFVGNLYLDSGQLLGTVRGMVKQESAATARGIASGRGDR